MSSQLFSTVVDSPVGSLTIVASDAAERVVGQAGSERVVLNGDDFLKPDEVGRVGGDGREKKLGAFRPGIVAVRRGGVADVERHHAPRFRRGRTRHKSEQEEQAEKKGHGRVC